MSENVGLDTVHSGLQEQRPKLDLAPLPPVITECIYNVVYHNTTIESSFVHDRVFILTVLKSTHLKK